MFVLAGTRKGDTLTRMVGEYARNDTEGGTGVEHQGLVPSKAAARLPLLPSLRTRWTRSSVSEFPSGLSHWLGAPGRVLQESAFSGI